MNDLTADPPAIQSYGSEVNALGTRIGADIDASTGGLDATTEGLRTPNTFAGLVQVWSAVAKGVSGEVCRAGDGTTQAGSDHDGNETTQTGGMEACTPN